MYNLISHLFTFCLWASKQNHTWTSSSKLHLFCCSVQKQKFFFSILLIVRTHMRVVYIKSGQLLGNCKEFKSSRKNSFPMKICIGRTKKQSKIIRFKLSKSIPYFLCVQYVYMQCMVVLENTKIANTFNKWKCFLLIPNT